MCIRDSCFSIIDHWWHYSIGDVTFIINQEAENRKYRQLITAYVKEKAMSQKWFIAFLGVMDYFNFSLSAFKSSRLRPCSPAVLSTQRFKESMAKEISSCLAIYEEEILMGKQSTRENKTIYQLCREAAGLTRAEASDKMEAVSEDVYKRQRLA